MNRIWELLHEKETVVLFDVDGTLTSYSYGDYHAHHELDYTPAFRDVNIYADCKRLEPIYDYIKSHDTARIFCISREPTVIAKKIVDEHFPGLSPRKVVCVDDSDETLGRYMKETDFCTAHPMIFMEYMGTDSK